MKKNSFLSGALIISAGALIAKIIGVLFKVPLTEIIGTEGLAIYNYPYQFYTTILAFSIAGLPVAISRLVSENVSNNNFVNTHRVFNVALVLMGMVGGLISVALIIFGKAIVGAFWPADAYYALMGLSLAPFFLSVLAVYRGYFLGLQVMNPTAISQVLEAVGRLVVGMGLVLYFVTMGIGKAAGGAAFGTTVGAAIGALTLIVYKWRHKDYHDLTQDSGVSEDVMTIIKKILVIAIPISIGALAAQIMGLIDSVMINPALTATGMSEQNASDLYGNLTAAFTMINFPMTLSLSLATSIVPTIAEEYSKNMITALRKRINVSIRLATYFAFPAMVGMFLLANEIILMLFPKATQGGPLLEILSIGMLVMIINQILTAVLQGSGKQNIPVINLFIGAAFKIGITYALIQVPELNIKAAAIGTVVSYGIIMVLNYIMTIRIHKFDFDLVKTWLIPLVGSLVMGVVVYLVNTPLTNMGMNLYLRTLISIGAGVVTYVLVVGGIFKFNIKKIKSLIHVD